MALAIAVPAIAQLPPPPEPAGNALTVEKARLGKALFWDEQMSSSRTVACGTCHIGRVGGADPRSADNPRAVHPGPDGFLGGPDDIFGSPGLPLSAADGTYEFSVLFGLREQVTSRRTMSSINAGYSPELFWDGRAAGEFVDPVTQQVILASGAALESQAVGPLVSDVEMAHVDRSWAEVIARVEAIDPLALAGKIPADLADWIADRDYAALFEEAFGSPGVTAPRIAMAIASYERTLLADQTPFDQWLVTGVGLTDQELAGRAVFAASSCDRCHQGIEFSDNDFHYTGVRPPADDVGRFEVTGLPDDMAKMRTPPLRNVQLRAPYMHNGRFASLEEVVAFYDRGGDFDAPNKDPFVRVLGLTQQEKDDLEAFLGRPLTDPRVAAEAGPFDRPRLYTESWGVPVVYGLGVPGLGGTTPRVVALEPPLLGNPSFTLGVYEADGGTQALLVIDDEDPGVNLPTIGGLAFETVPLADDGSGLFYGSVSLALPSDPALHGSAHFGRWYVLDAGGSQAVAVSRPFRFKLFQSGGLESLFEDGFESGGAAFWSNMVP